MSSSFSCSSASTSRPRGDSTPNKASRHASRTEAAHNCPLSIPPCSTRFSMTFEERLGKVGGPPKENSTSYRSS